MPGTSQDANCVISPPPATDAIRRMAAKSIEIIPHIIAEEMFVSFGFGCLMTNMATT
jgi:hypothetical protein